MSDIVKLIESFPRGLTIVIQIQNGLFRITHNPVSEI